MKNVPEFEGLRGFLSTIIVLAHLHVPMVSWVWGSMDIFFCMSGFLIGQIILREQTKYGFLRRYAWRRITRIWPAYYATLAGCLVFAFFVTKISQLLLHWTPGLGCALDIVFLQNTEIWLRPGFTYAGRLPDYLPFLAHTWSVALEEQFYVLAPLICLVIVRFRRPEIGAAVFTIGCCAISLLLRSKGFSWNILPARFDGFSVGIFSAVIVHRERTVGHQLKAVIPLAWALFLLGGIASVLLFALVAPPRFELGGAALASPAVIYGVSGVAIFSGGLVLLLSAYTGHKNLTLLRWRPLLGLGRMSYSTYLIHIPVIWYLDFALVHWMPLSGLEKFSIQFPLCFGAAYVLYVLVERPVMQLRGSTRST